MRIFESSNSTPDTMSKAYFNPTTISFLQELRENNIREWFEENRSTYEEQVLKPMRDLTQDLEPLLKSFDARIDMSPAIGKAVSRIYRDTRFSLDKTPYRSECWLSFKRPKKIFGNVPEFFMVFTPEEYMIGMGFWATTPAFMTRFRNFISVNHEEFGAFLDCFEQSGCQLYGEDYKKKIPNDLPERFQPWIQKRSVYISRNRALDELFFSPDLKQKMIEVYQASAVLYGFMLECVED